MAIQWTRATFRLPFVTSFCCIMRTLASEVKTIVKRKHYRYVVISNILEQHRKIEIIGMKVSEMDNIWFNLFYPRNQFSCPPPCAIAMQSQQSRIESIVKMILPFPSYLETIRIRCSSLSVSHKTLVPLRQQNLRQLTSGSARTSPVANRIDLEYSHLIQFKSKAFRQQFPLVVCPSPPSITRLFIVIYALLHHGNER